jgi:hypothetical protein
MMLLLFFYIGGAIAAIYNDNAAPFDGATCQGGCRLALGVRQRSDNGLI